MINQETLTKFEDKLINTLAFACQKYNRQFEIPKLVFRQMGLKAGVARLQANTIELNEDYCKNGHLQDMIDRTLVHELAHLIAYQVYRDNGHGRGWKRVTNDLTGKVMSRCHNYNTEGVKTRKLNTRRFVWYCNCREHNVSTRTHNSLMKWGLGKCRLCKTEVKYKGEKIA